MKIKLEKVMSIFDADTLDVAEKDGKVTFSSPTKSSSEIVLFEVVLLEGEDAAGAAKRVFGLNAEIVKGA